MNPTKITFATNTAKDTLEYTKLLLQSLKDNLDNKEHQILVFVDCDNDGTVDYLKSIKHEFYDLTIITHNVQPIVGCQRNQNIIVEQAKYDIVSYLQCDMIISKHYDTNILKSLKPNTILSSTRIEPPLHGPSEQTITANFGLDPEGFDYESFLAYAETCKVDKTINYFFAPYTFHKETWFRVGGYDTIFRRSRCDSDLVQRCLHAGIVLEQTFNANVYHFTCTHSRGKNWYDKTNKVAQERVRKQELADRIEVRKFIRKWGDFNHGEEILNKLDIDLIIDGEEIKHHQLAYELEPFVSRVWVRSSEMKQNLLNYYLSEHDLANELFSVAKEDWYSSMHLCNHTDYNNIYNVGTPNNYNIAVYITNSSDIQLLIENITKLSKSLATYEIGTYDFGGTIIDIKNIRTVNQELMVTNPNFDNKLINIM